MVLLASCPLSRFRSLSLLCCLVLHACSDRNGNKNFPTQANNEQPPPTYEELAKTQPAIQLNQMGDSVFEIGEYDKAIAFYQQSMDSAAAQADSFPYYDSKLDLACVHDRLSEFQKAIEVAEPVVAAFIRSGDSTRIGRAYAALAGFYGKASMHEKSMDAAQKGFDILKQYGSLIERCAAYNQMAFTYSDQGDWARALPLLDTALQLMEASGTLNQRPGMRLNIGDCHRNLGHWSEARRYIEAAAAEADHLGQAHVLARALERLSQIAESTSDPASALRLFRRAKAIRDSLFTTEKARSMQELEVQYQTAEKKMEISLLRSQQQTEVARRKLLLAVLGIAAATVGLLLFRWREKLRHSQRAIAEHQQRLYEFSRLLMSKNARITELETALQPEEATNAVEQISPQVHTALSPPEVPSEDLDSYLYNKHILTDSDWHTFKNYFDRANPHYIHRLRATFPNLSSAEERLFLLIKLGFNSIEAATTLGISKDSIKKGRQRLRKRLMLKAEEDLEQFVQSF